MHEDYILALDQGSTSSRALLFNHRGEILARGQVPLSVKLPRPGWVEHDPEEIWQSIAQAVDRVFQEKPDARDHVVAVGLANQRETVVVWDKATGRAVAPAISWQCRRTTEICQYLKSRGLNDGVHEKTGLTLDPYFSATKMSWLLNHDPELRRLDQNHRLAVGTVDSWLLYHLTGGQHLTDVSNASRTLLFNLHTLSWDADLLDVFGVPAHILPQVVDSAGTDVMTQGGWFSRSLPIAGIAGDQQASLFGHGCLRPGMIKSTYGTGAFVLMNTGPTPVANPGVLLSTVAWRMRGETHYALEGSLFASGSVVEWLRDNLELIHELYDSEVMAFSVADTAGVYFVPAFVGLGAPYWDSDARGTIVGLTRNARKAHLVRAALESSAFQTRDIIETMIKESGYPVSRLSVDGGLSYNRFFTQFQADVLGVPVKVPSVKELTALGAAALAAEAIGWDTSSWRSSANGDEVYWPQMTANERDHRYGEWRKAVKRALGWAENEISKDLRC
ncbi:MAG: glycerol kinase GlpK [Firmicutes bacterium]|nr:glycerol kinase GlpK [Bacillota bacterium]